MRKIVLITGGFDPLHSGHIAYINAAKDLGDILVVGVNSDLWLARKKGSPFMSHYERCAIVQNIKAVDAVIDFDDDDGSAIHAIRLIRKQYPNDTIIFANGGDRTRQNIPEMEIDDNNLEFVFGIGGTDKKNSSSWILQDWRAAKTPRPWGYYRVLHDVSGMKVKELTVEPGKSLSMQRHQHRAEYWMVSEGECIVHTTSSGGYSYPPKHMTRHQEFNIPVSEWHQLTNPFNVPCKIVEIQYGEKCIEEDIERK